MTRKDKNICILKHFLLFLKANKAYKNYRFEITHNKHKRVIYVPDPKFAPRIDAIELLSRPLIWDCTKKGYAYYQKLTQQWMEYCKNILMKEFKDLRMLNGYEESDNLFQELFTIQIIRDSWMTY